MAVYKKKGKNWYIDYYVKGRRKRGKIDPSKKYKAAGLENVSPATGYRQPACLKHMYTKAKEWGCLKTNPVKAVKSLKEPHGRLRYSRDSVSACNY